MSEKTVRLNKTGIEKLPDDKPVVYWIKSEGGNINYGGSAQKGRVRARIAEHLGDGSDPVPGAKVQIQQQQSIAEARQKEQRVIKRIKTKYNKRTK